VAEVLVQFTDVVEDEEGNRYIARACGGEMPDSRWQGWIEFIPENGGAPIRSRRETTQPNRTDTEYWATGLTDVYLEGALRRAMSPHRPPADPIIPPPVFNGPAGEEDAPAPPPRESILNPFSVYRKGEDLLRSQLSALSPWHLANIIEAHHLSDASAATLTTFDPDTLIEIIVSGVRGR
jgi:hypothetical protein